MKKILVFIYFLTITIIHSACKEKQTTSSTTDDPKTRDTQTDMSKDSLPQINCYLFTSGRDSYFLQLNPAYNGKMEFRNYQKDQSFGTVKGRKDGDIIKLWYDFQSEGMSSVSEIHLKEVGDDLILGLGDVRVSNDTTYNADSKIDFENGQLFNKIDCDKFRFRY